MYLPAHFEEQRLDVLHGFVHWHPFGLLISQGPDGMVANSMPFILDADGPGAFGVLRAHVARANPVWRDCTAGSPALVVFQGPQDYVSPAWYPSKAEHGKVVPTWNYVMVQARGPLRFIDDAEWLRTFVTRLTERHEAGRTTPWAVTDAPAPFVDTMLKAIVGVEIELSTLTGKWKVSQNRPAADRQGTVQGLDAVGTDNARALARQVDSPGAAE